MARTGEPGEAGPPPFGLFVVERDAPGFERGRKLRKVGMHAQDTAELFFTDVRVRAENVLGDPGRGFVSLMENLPLERLSIAVTSLGAARSALGWTADHVRERHAFGKPLAAQQSIQFTIAEIATEVDVTRSYVRDAVRALNAGTLTPVDAAKAKWWATEVHKRTVDRCLQLFGGYGYMAEYPIARAFVDARVQTIYGGATEIMKLLIARDVLGKFSLSFCLYQWEFVDDGGGQGGTGQRYHRPVGRVAQRRRRGPLPILATARDLFYEVGFHGTTVRDIASRVGVTVPALYYHHANKEAILAALLDRSISNVIDRCQQALSEAGDDPAERFRNLVECLALYMANHLKSGAMDAEIRALSPAARKLYSVQRRRVEQMVADTISQGAAAGVFDVTSPSETGRALLGMIQAITLWFRPGGGRLTASELAVRYVDIAERTVGLRRSRGGAGSS